MAGPEKSDGAFRTIREVADWLGVPTHVLRFWESKFDQIAPVKGAGGRRYYRPEDMRLLGGIKVMLHDQGLPIRGVIQKIDDEGSEAVMTLSPDLDMPDTAAAPRTRRVIRQGEDIAKPGPRDAGATTVQDRRDPSGATTATAEIPPDPAPKPAPEPRTGIAPLPEPEEPEPGQPGDEMSSGQLGDETESPQPSDEPFEEPLDGSGQPDVPTTGRGFSKAPVTDPESDSEPDIAPEPEPVSEPVPEPAPDTDTEPAEHRDPATPAPAVFDADEVDSSPRAPSTPAPAAPDLPAPGTDARAGGEAGSAIYVPAGSQRRLRRIIRKLRGLIEDVEGELREEARNAAEPAAGA